MLKRIVSTMFAAMFLVGLIGITSACNTVHGLGQDIERGGEKIKQEANEHK